MMIRRSAGLAALALATLGTTCVNASESGKGTRVSPGGTTRVFVMASFGMDCKSLAAAKIDIEAAPQKGTVSFREGQSTTVQYSLSGRCIGTKVMGTGIYYTARPDAEGADTFKITARLATGETASRTFALDIKD